MKLLKAAVAFSIMNAIVMTAIVSRATLLQPPRVATTLAVPTESVLPSLPPIRVDTASSTPRPTPRPTPRKTATPIKQSTPSPTHTPTTVTTETPTPLPTQAATPTPPSTDSRCLIQIDGVTYDVTVFRTIHSGGNVFQCGTDMSAIFWSRHNQQILNQMQQYRL